MWTFVTSTTLRNQITHCRALKIAVARDLLCPSWHKLKVVKNCVFPSVSGADRTFSPHNSAAVAGVSVSASRRQSAPSNRRSILGMAVWPSSAFTYGIYRVSNPQSRLHLAALFHVSVCSRIGTRNGAARWKIPRRMAVRLRGLREGFRRSRQVRNSSPLLDHHAGLRSPGRQFTGCAIKHRTGRVFDRCGFRQRTGREHSSTNQHHHQQHQVADYSHSRPD
jgi:hypothetical protein